MKSHYYCANTTRVYRQAIDSWESGNYNYDPKWLEELCKMSHRGYTSGFFHGKLDRHSQQLDGGIYRTHNFAAYVKEQVSETEVLLEVRERFDTTKPVELITPGQNSESYTLGPVVNTKSKETITFVQPNMHIIAKKPLKDFDILVSSQKHEA